MSPEERRRRGTKLCARIAAEVQELAPAGIGNWPECWDIVADPDAEFMLQLLRWERSGAESDKESVRTAYAQVLDAWRNAVAAWESIEA